MRIAIVDVAAENGGATSVLFDILKYICNSSYSEKHEWLIYTSMPINTCNNMKNIVVAKVKKRWLNRLFWEIFEARKDLENRGVDCVLSLQNTGMLGGKYKQYVYFHNVLLLQPANKYSLLKSEERKFAIYTKFISRYTLKTLNKVDKIFVQLETVKKGLEQKKCRSSISVIQPTISLPSQYRNTVQIPFKGIIYPTSSFPFKRIEEIIDCVKKNRDWFLEHGFEVVITISGDENNYARSLMERKKEVDQIVRFIGYQTKDAIMKQYQNHILLISSEMESYCIPFSEAAFVGAPIIAADYDYAKERLENFENAFIYEHGSINSLFNAINAAVNTIVRYTPEFDEYTNGWERLLKEMV